VCQAAFYMHLPSHAEPCLHHKRHCPIQAQPVFLRTKPSCRGHHMGEPGTGARAGDGGRPDGGCGTSLAADSGATDTWQQPQYQLARRTAAAKLSIIRWWVSVTSDSASLPSLLICTEREPLACHGTVVSEQRQALHVICTFCIVSAQWHCPWRSVEKWVCQDP